MPDQNQSHNNNDLQGKEYIQRYLNGEIEVRDKIIESFLPLAKKLAYGYYLVYNSYGIEREDLCSVGTIGLIKAVDNIKQRSIKEIISFISSYILGEIRHYVRDNALAISFSRRAVEANLFKIPAIIEEFINNNGREPTTTELINLVHNDKGVATLALNLKTMTFSMDSTIENSDSEEMRIFEILADPNAINPSDNVDSIVLNGIVKSLGNLRDVQIITLRYGLSGREEMTQTEVARELGCAQYTVSREEKKILNKIRQRLEGSYY